MGFTSANGKKRIEKLPPSISTSIFFLDQRLFPPTKYALRDKLTKQSDVSKTHVLVTTPIIHFVMWLRQWPNSRFTQLRNILD